MQTGQKYILWSETFSMSKRDNWKKLTQDMNILSIVQGFKVPFSQTSFQYGPPQLARLNQEERLRKDAIQQLKSEPGEFLNNLVLVNKKDGGHRPVINLKFLNSFIPYQHFKTKGMHLIEDLLQEHDFLIKIDLKDAYSGIPLDKSSRKYIRFPWEGIYTNSSTYVLSWVQPLWFSQKFWGSQLPY